MVGNKGCHFCHLSIPANARQFCELSTSLVRTEKCNKWVGVWTTNVYSVDKPNEHGEYGAWNDHTVWEDLEWELAVVRPLNHKRPCEPCLCYMWRNVHGVRGGGLTAGSSTSHDGVLYITWWSTVHHVMIHCTSQRDVLTNTCVTTVHDAKYLLNITC